MICARLLAGDAINAAPNAPSHPMILSHLDLHWAHAERHREPAAQEKICCVPRPHTHPKFAHFSREGRSPSHHRISGYCLRPNPTSLPSRDPFSCPIPASCRGVFGSANPFDQPSAGRQRDCTSVDATPNTLYKTFCGCIRKKDFIFLLSGTGLLPLCSASASGPPGRKSEWVL